MLDQIIQLHTSAKCNNNLTFNLSPIIEGDYCHVLCDEHRHAGFVC